MDFIVDLPPAAGHTCILVVVDLLTKMAHFIPCKGLPSAREMADLYLRHVFRLHEAPENLITDRGSQFTSHFWHAFHTLLGTQVHLSTAHHPQTDGQTERTNATLEQYLRCYVNHQQSDWLDLLPVAEFAYNNALHSSTQQTPFMANYGFHPRFFPETTPVSTVPAADDRIQELQALQQVLQMQLEQAKDSYKTAADRKRQLHVGDWVWLSTRYLHSSRTSRKLDARYVGPFLITDQIN